MTSKIPERDPAAQFLSNLDHLDSIKDKSHLYKFTDGRIQERSGLDRLIKSITYKYGPTSARVESDVLTNQLAAKVIDDFAKLAAAGQKNHSFTLTLGQAKVIHAARSVEAERKVHLQPKQEEDSPYLYFHQPDQSQKITSQLFGIASGKIRSEENNKRDLQAAQGLYSQLIASTDPAEINQLLIKLYKNESALPILAKFAEATSNMDGHEFIKATLDLQAAPTDDKMGQIMEKFIIHKYNPEDPMGLNDDPSHMPVELGSRISDPLIAKYKSVQRGDVEHYGTYIPFGAEKIKMSPSDFEAAFINVIGKMADTIKKGANLEFK